MILPLKIKMLIVRHFFSHFFLTLFNEQSKGVEDQGEYLPCHFAFAEHLFSTQSCVLSSNKSLLNYILIQIQIYIPNAHHTVI